MLFKSQPWIDPCLQLYSCISQEDCYHTDDNLTRSLGPNFWLDWTSSFEPFGVWAQSFQPIRKLRFLWHTEEQELYILVVAHSCSWMSMMMMTMHCWWQISKGVMMIHCCHLLKRNAKTCRIKGRPILKGIYEWVKPHVRYQTDLSEIHVKGEVHELFWEISNWEDEHCHTNSDRDPSCENIWTIKGVGRFCLP